MSEKELTPDPLSKPAKRAIAEADERRRIQEKNAKSPPPETGGRKGPDPVRFGDWEKNGIVSDF